MVHKIWLYLLISLGFVFAFLFYKDRKFQYSFWLVVASLGVLIGGNFILADKTSSIQQSLKSIDKEVEILKQSIGNITIFNRQLIKKAEELGDLERKLAEDIDYIRRVGEDITRIKGKLKTQSALKVTERFVKKNIGEKILVLTDSQDVRNTLVIMELKDLPQPDSIEIINERGDTISQLTYEIQLNIINLHLIGVVIQDVLATDQEFFEVRYVPYEEKNRKLLTIKGLDLTTTKDGTIFINYQYRDKN